ncbi:2-C-methyl-D-erythritol 4-phosphate cytidylyltransferase [Desulfovibrio legallii]|uniref:Bifunctional enzyme IspD/IspF n=1 Tax=Desulfovibrio legallii TaxID=571438 RepID=A0A1G7LCP5_9BACT|nr:2-C-methyl-D-erythritol 4-phosphate cytidylyltransferase [Desulfovibrio legallii]SDF47171.1 2-C-methyl-D-erythritol 2,4-cyclodiphosphate synthase [Desulfovibrio legallii]
MPHPFATPEAADAPWAIVLAAGRGSRMAAATGGEAKQFLSWRGLPLYWHAAQAMSRSGLVAGLVFVFPPERRAVEEERLRALCRSHDFGLPWRCAAGGPARQDSVRLGLEALPPRTRFALVHDAARPFASPALVARVCAALQQGAAGVVPALPVTDTIKTVEGDRVLATLPRHSLAAVQTPQGFRCDVLHRAHQAALAAGNGPATDDAALLEALGEEVRVVPGEAANVKLTRPEDLSLLRPAAPAPRFCTGFGYDVHRYGPGRPMRLGGVPIAEGPQVVAHSDGDVLLHALADALLGCAGLGDIGRHFPDSDPALEGVSSALLLDQVLTMVREAGVTPCHADLTVVAQKPRLSPHGAAIRKNVARLLGLPLTCVNVKATTEEGLGFTGRLEGIKACAVVSAQAASLDSADLSYPLNPPAERL